MKGTDLLMAMQALGAVSSYSRPWVSNDNTYAEALLRTAKYCIGSAVAAGWTNGHANGRFQAARNGTTRHKRIWRQCGQIHNSHPNDARCY